MKRYEKIIIALDVKDIKEAEKYLKIFSPYIKIFKVGPRLFIPYGKKIINLITSYDCETFLDLKLHDIPSQVASSVSKIAQFGIKFFTVHALGGRQMLKEARQVLDDFPVDKRPYMLAVTVLTSLDEKDLQFLNFKNKINILVFKLTELALNAGADGIVCSVKEVRNLKHRIGQRFIAVVPGIRLISSYDDQKRTGTISEALRWGADYVVVGRQILQADDPLKILKEVK